jgi:hypothetical protein
MDDDIWVDFARLTPLIARTKPQSEFWIQGMLQVINLLGMCQKNNSNRCLVYLSLIANQ